MKKVLLGLMVCLSANCFASTNNNQNNSDTIYNNGDTNYNTTNQGGIGVGYGGTGVGYGGTGYASNSNSNYNSGYNSQSQGQYQDATAISDSYSSAASRANADAVSRSNVDSRINSKNSNDSGANANVSSPVTINDSRSQDTVIPRQAPAASAPSMTGAMGTDSVSGGFSTPLGGVSFGRSKTTPEGTALLRAQKTAIDLTNLATVSSCDGLYPEDCARIRRQILRGYGK